MKSFWRQFGLGALAAILTLALVMLAAMKAHGAVLESSDPTQEPAMFERIIVAILPVFVPVIVNAVRDFTDHYINTKYIPLLLAIVGALVSSAYSYLGMAVPDFTALGADAWNGALVALAGTGIHQLFTQLRKPS